MKTRQAKKILKRYLHSDGWFYWSQGTFASAFYLGRRKGWSMYYIYSNWRMERFA